MSLDRGLTLNPRWTHFETLRYVCKDLFNQYGHIHNSRETDISFGGPAFNFLQAAVTIIICLHLNIKFLGSNRIELSEVRKCHGVLSHFFFPPPWFSSIKINVVCGDQAWWGGWVWQQLWFRLTQRFSIQKHFRITRGNVEKNTGVWAPPQGFWFHCSGVGTWYRYSLKLSKLYSCAVKVG